MVYEGIEELWSHLTDVALEQLTEDGFEYAANLKLYERCVTVLREILEGNRKAPNPASFHNSIVSGIRYDFEKKKKLQTKKLKAPVKSGYDGPDDYWRNVLKTMLLQQGVQEKYHEAMIKRWTEVEGKTLQQFCEYRTYQHEPKPWMD